MGNLYGPGDLKIHYRRDRYGLRGDYVTPSQIDVLTMGASATDQRYIDESSTWQAVLAKAFLARQKRKVSVVNAGVDGQSTVRLIRHFQEWFPQIPSLRPRFVLFWVGYAEPDASTAAKEWKEYRTERENESPALWWQSLLERSALAHSIRAVIGTLHMSELKLAGHKKTNFESLVWTPETLQKDHERSVAARLDSYETRLRRLNALARHLGARPIWVTAVTRHYRIADGGVQGSNIGGYYAGEHGNGLDDYHILRLFNTRTMRVCREVGAICLDFASDVPLEDADFYNFEHLTPQGAEKLGGYLYEKLKDVI